MKKLANSYLNGRDKYPETVVAAYNLILNWAGRKSEAIGNNDAVTSGTNEDLDETSNITFDDNIFRRDG